MNYIVHHRFKDKGACGKYFNLPYGTKLITVGEFIATTDKKIICFPTSENGRKYFAINEDGKGLERGALTYAIAYQQRNAGNGFRFSDDEAKLIKENYSHFLRQDADVILFNDSFFEADVKELQALADALNIKIKQ